MRSSKPVPGNPWPHDMVITVEEDPTRLIELLWIREAWDLPSAMGEPPRLSATPQRIGSVDRSAPWFLEWSSEWGALWNACVLHAATPRDPSLSARSFDDPPTHVP
jgi:hypothetical protein